MMKTQSFWSCKSFICYFWFVKTCGSFSVDMASMLSEQFVKIMLKFQRNSILPKASEWENAKKYFLGNQMFLCYKKLSWEIIINVEINNGKPEMDYSLIPQFCVFKKYNWK